VVLSLFACRPATQIEEPPQASVDAALEGCIDVFSAPRLTSTAAFADEQGLLIGGFVDTPRRPGAYLLKADASGAIV
jgi:hypothetical protein